MNSKSTLAFMNKEIKDTTEAVVWRCSIEKALLEISQHWRPATLLNKRLWHRCFSVNFAKSLRTPLFKEQLRWLLLIQRERPKGKCLESSWAVFNSIFMNNTGPSDTLKGRTIFLLLLLKSSLCKYYKMRLYNWHASSAINLGKLLVLLCF